MANPLKPTRECVIWRDGARRCELWLLGGVEYLRVYDAGRLLTQQPATADAVARARQIRRALPAPRPAARSACAV